METNDDIIMMTKTRHAKTEMMQKENEGTWRNGGDECGISHLSATNKVNREGGRGRC